MHMTPNCSGLPLAAAVALWLSNNEDGTYVCAFAVLASESATVPKALVAKPLRVVTRSNVPSLWGTSRAPRYMKYVYT